MRTIMLNVLNPNSEDMLSDLRKVARDTMKSDNSSSRSRSGHRNYFKLPSSKLEVELP